MFEKKYSFNIDNFSTFPPAVEAGLSRVSVTPEGNITIIRNNEDKFTFITRTAAGCMTALEVDTTYGQLVGTPRLQGNLWLEFRDILAPYEEEYSIVKTSATQAELVTNFTRESYSHDLKYHHLFTQNGEIYLHLIKHNRLHHYRIKEDLSLEEIDILEGGKWYLCGTYPVCSVGDTLEFYDPSLNIRNTVEYDYEIDELHWGVSGGLMAVTVTDISQEQTALIIYQQDTETLLVDYIEHTVSDMGLSNGRIWINPYRFLEQQDLGGCMVFDRYSWPLYTHLRTKSPNIPALGIFPPPFHRSEGIYELPDGMTLVMESTKLLILDYNCRPIQEIFIPHPECCAVSENGDTLAILQLDREKFTQDHTSTYETITVDVYGWNSTPTDDKVIEMIKFQR